MKLLKSKKGSIDKPWLKLYKGIPEKLDYPECTMFELIENSSIKYPNNIAYDYFGTTCNYKNLIDKIHEVAKALKMQNIKENDIVTICMPNIPQAIIAFYAINLIGAIANVIHPLSGEKEIENYLKTTNSNLVLTIDISFEKIEKVISNTKVKKIIVATAADDMKFLTSCLYWIFKGNKIEIDPNSKKVLKWKEFVNLGKNYKGIYRIRKKSSDSAVILYSGGTTGTPKGILLSNMNFNALALQSHFMCGSCGAGDSILAIMPIFHGFGLGESIHAPLYIGMKCILIPTFKATDFDNLIIKNKPNFVIGVPTLFEALLKYGKFKGKSLAFIKNFISGGDVISDETKKKIDSLLLKHGSKTTLRVGYGLTEGTCASCLTPEIEYEKGSIGIPFPDTVYKIVKIGTHDEVPYNIDGEICISGPTVMMGYYNDLNETIQVLRTHKDGRTWLHTGDVGCMKENGVIIFKQRIKRIIVSSGYNIYPSYIENIINSHSAVLTSTVIGIDHPYKVQVAKAYIVLKNKPKDLKSVKKSMKAHCEKNIAKYSLPYAYEFRESLPKTLIGKVAFNKLVEEEKIKNK